METKDLIWKDNITDKGKENGWFELLSNIDELRLTYHIRNWKYYSDKPTNKYYLFHDGSSLYPQPLLEHNSINECKEFAQKHFTNLIKTLFLK